MAHWGIVGVSFVLFMYVLHTGGGGGGLVRNRGIYYIGSMKGLHSVIPYLPPARLFTSFLVFFTSSCSCTTLVSNGCCCF